MEKFITITSKVIPVNLDNVDTDMIIPAQHLKSVSKEGFGQHLFSNLRQMYPDFILNQPAYANGEVLISKSNFGCGSSREHAAWAIQQYGIKVVICSSFGDIFLNNSAKNGILLITLPEATIEKWINLSLADSTLKIDINLEKQTVTFAGDTHTFEYDSFRKHCLINGLDDLDYLLSLNTEITQYEQKNCTTSW
ncbi:MAG: 3-isopropylmalate dehydratase small subunit [Neisseriaceae bacterium]|nr:MAG: 3-isopropylmalate dehydratase small subunit [Neisseriaceae bacterium]